MSRASQARPAVRTELKARLFLTGPAGAGKTWTGLAIATGLAGDAKPVVIDTEEESAQTYADEYGFAHLRWEPPYSPQELADTIRDLEADYPVIMVDSASHFWTREGGTLDIADGHFRGWKEATPAQNDMVEAIMRSRAHLVVCARSKMAYNVSADGKTISKVGLAPVQREDFEYEMQVTASVDMAHKLTVGKTRAKPLAGRTFAPGKVNDFVELYRDWLDAGEALASPDVIAALRARIAALAERDVRRAVTGEIAATLGIRSLDRLLAESVPTAEAIIAAHEEEPS